MLATLHDLELFRVPGHGAVSAIPGIHNSRHTDMGKPDALDRLVQFLIAIPGLMSLANGAFMVWDPHGWYTLLPTVQSTGPGNLHFIRDIGLAYVTAGTLLGYAARFPSGRWLGAVAGVLWLGMHGGLHVWELFTGLGAAHAFWVDAPSVLGPPLMVLVALGILFARQRIAPAGVPKRLVLDAITKKAPGESGYLHEIAGAPGYAFEKLLHFMPVAMHRHAAAADLFHMTRIGATLVEDCGPCALTAAQMALSDRVPRRTVNAALAQEPLEGDLQVAFNFGQAIALRSVDASALGDAIEANHGRSVRLELAMTAATVRAYPAMKRGLGLTKSCSVTRLEV